LYLHSSSNIYLVPHSTSLNNSLQALQTSTLKDILTKLKANNLRKQQLLKAIEKGDKKDQATFSIKSTEEFPPFPCKLNDLRFFIENLSPELTEDDIKDYFEDFGDVVDLRLDPDVKKAFITFSHFHGDRPGKNHEIKETSVILEGVFKESDKPSTTICVTGDIEDVSGDSMRKFLRQYGTITDYRRTVNHKTSRLSRFIFVKFEKPQDVEKIMNSRKHLIRSRAEKFDFNIIQVDEH
jgi:RNA recognition motif-containing protein